MQMLAGVRKEALSRIASLEAKAAQGESTSASSSAASDVAAVEEEVSAPESEDTVCRSMQRVLPADLWKHVVPLHSWTVAENAA